MYDGNIDTLSFNRVTERELFIVSLCFRGIVFGRLCLVLEVKADRNLSDLHAIGIYLRRIFGAPDINSIPSSH